MNSSKVLILRTCNQDLTSHGGFQWPERGFVECKDFNSKAECGNGLHGLLWGEGSVMYLSTSDTAKWLVCEVNQKDTIELGGKIKFPECHVVFCGEKKGAIEYLQQNGAANKVVVFSTATSGDWGKSTSGDYGKSISGDWGKSVSGEYGKSTSGYKGKSTSGYKGKSISGDWGKSISGDHGESVSGDRGESVSGYGGKSVSGDHGESVSGYGGESVSGKGGILVIKWWDNRCRLAVAYVGEAGIKPDTAYKLIDNGQFVEAKT